MVVLAFLPYVAKETAQHNTIIILIDIHSDNLPCIQELSVICWPYLIMVVLSLDQEQWDHWLSTSVILATFWVFHLQHTDSVKWTEHGAELSLHAIVSLIKFMVSYFIWLVWTNFCVCSCWLWKLDWHLKWISELNWDNIWLYCYLQLWWRVWSSRFLWASLWSNGTVEWKWTIMQK